jgi:hypothetical protein
MKRRDPKTPTEELRPKPESKPPEPAKLPNKHDKQPVPIHRGVPRPKR